MDRIYTETDVRGAMPAITAPVLLMARERDRAALEYYASLLRQPTIRVFPGQDAMKPEEMQDKPLFEKFKNPLAATSLEILKYDEATSTIAPFKVAQVNNRWSIPSLGE